MKRIRKRIQAPKGLRSYIEEHDENSPEHTWDAFRAGEIRLKEVQDALLEDQGKLCAYCELELFRRYDFRVSHFHPKRADTEPRTRKWELCWSNMHGCCNGGSVNYYAKPERHVETNDAKDRHCDVVVGNEIIDDVVLNPLLIPAFPRLFGYREVRYENGDNRLEIEVDKSACAEVSYQGVLDCRKRAECTIDKYHLNSANLARMRYATSEAIKVQLCKFGEENIATSMKALAQKAFCSKTKWPEFFTVWRWMLRDVAEKELRRIGYDG